MDWKLLYWDILLNNSFTYSGGHIRIVLRSPGDSGNWWRGQIPQTAPSAVTPFLICNIDWVAKPVQIYFLNFSLTSKMALPNILKQPQITSRINTKYKSLVNNLILIYHSIIFEVTKSQGFCLVAMHFVMLAFLRSVVWPHFWSTVLHIQQNTEVE